MLDDRNADVLVDSVKQLDLSTVNLWDNVVSSVHSSFGYVADAGVDYLPEFGDWVPWVIVGFVVVVGRRWFVDL